MGEFLKQFGRVVAAAIVSVGSALALLFLAALVRLATGVSPGSLPLVAFCIPLAVVWADRSMDADPNARPRALFVGLLLAATMRLALWQIS